MKRTTLVLPVCAMLLMLARPAAATDATPDKSGFTLLNPTPVADLRDIDPDRPDKTNTPHTVDAGHLQIEFGLFDYLYNRDRYHGANARIDSLGIAQFNFRLGVLNNIELDAVINPAQFERDTDDIAHRTSRQSTFGDTVIGGELNFWGNDDNDKLWDTALGIQPQFKIASAREPSGNGHPEFVVGLPFTVNLPEDFHLSLQTSVSWQRSINNTGYVTGWENSASLDHNLFTKLDVYLEYWSEVTTEGRQESQETLDLGCQYALTENLVFDTGANLGLNHASPSIEWVAGATVRF